MSCKSWKTHAHLHSFCVGPARLASTSKNGHILGLGTKNFVTTYHRFNFAGELQGEATGPIGVGIPFASVIWDEGGVPIGD